MTKDLSRRKVLAGLGAVGASSLAGCMDYSRVSGTNEELIEVTYSTDKKDLPVNNAILFENSGELYGIEMLGTEGESANIRIGSYDIENTPTGPGSYLRAETEEIEIEAEDVLTSNEVPAANEGFPEITIEDIDPGYAQLDFGIETEMELVHENEIDNEPGFA